MKFLRYLSAAIVILAFVRCGENKAAPAKPADDPIPVKLKPVAAGSFGKSLQYSGLIASNAEARLSFKIGGIISRIYVKEGDHVEKGQLLATLDLTEIDAQVQQATQNLEKSKRDEGRLKNLYRDTVASLEQVQNAHTQMTVASEALRIAEFNRQYARVVATSSGTILHKFLNEGEYAAAGTAVLQMNGTGGNDWVVRFGVSDRDWAMLRKGERADVMIEAYPGEHFGGLITKMAEAADPANGTYAIEVNVAPAGHRLAPGLFCTVVLQPASKQRVTMIPVEALAEGDGKTGFVYSLNADGRTVTRHTVRVAFLEKDQLAISEGLDSVSSVITDGVGYLTERSVVKVIQ